MTKLCVLLPVFNAHQILEDGVGEILELFAELTDRFELCVLDDGSTDDTPEVARELSARYPQIRLLRHATRRGLSEAIRTALHGAPGEILLVLDDHYSLAPDDLRALWQLRDLGRPRDRQSLALSIPGATSIDKLLAANSGRADMRGNRSFEIVRRATYEQFRLEQSLESIARVDRAIRQPTSAGASRPKYLGKVSYLVREK